MAERGGAKRSRSTARQPLAPLCPRQLIFVAIWALVAVIITWAAAGAPWAFINSNNFVGLAYACLSWTCGFYYTALATAACVLLSVAGIFGFFGVAVPLLCGMCARGRSCCGGPACALAFAILTFILTLAGTIVGGLAFTTDGSLSYSYWLNNFQSPGYGLAVAASCMWLVTIIVAAAMSCCCTGSPKPVPAPADPTAFAGANPSAPMAYA